MNENQSPGVERAIELVTQEFMEHGRYDDPLMPGLQLALRELEALRDNGRRE